MNNGTYRAILLKSKDYRESDKLLRLLTLENGVITALMRGVKKPDAKLRFAAQPFAFCEYSLHKRGDFFTVTSSSIIEDLFSLSQDYDKFVSASILLEIADNATGDEANPALFILLLKCLKKILCSDTSPQLTAVYFCQSAIHSSGYTYQYPKPPANITSPMDLLAYTNGVDIESLNNENIPDDLIKNTLLKIIKNFENKFGCVINSAKLV